MSETVTETTSGIGALAAALAEAKRAYRPLAEDSTARIDSKKGARSSFEYSYSSLAAINAAVDDALADNGLCTITTLTPDAVVMVLVHTGGGAVESRAAIPEFADLKEYGGHVKSLSRYLKLALVGVAAPPAPRGGRSTPVSNRAQPPGRRKAAAARGAGRQPAGSEPPEAAPSSTAPGQKPPVDLDEAIRRGVEAVGLSEQKQADLFIGLDGNKTAIVNELKELYQLKQEQGGAPESQEGAGS